MKATGKSNLSRALVAAAFLAAISGFVYGASAKLGAHVGQKVIDRTVLCASCGDLFSILKPRRVPAAE